MVKTNEVKLNYDKTHLRYRKMVNGKAFISSRGLLQTNADRNKAIAEFLHWQDEQSKAEALAYMIPGPFVSMGDPANDLTQGNYFHERHEAAIQKAGRKTLAQFADSFIRFKTGRVVHDEVNRLTVAMEWFKELVGSATSMTPDLWDKIDADLQSRISNATWSRNYAQSRQNAVRMLFNWLYETEKISEKPRCVYAKQFNITVPSKLPQFFTKEEITAIFAIATPEQKLHYSLMLNTGSTAKDLSELDWSMIDLSAGTLTRKRTKHMLKENEQVPTVVYTLWQTVRDALAAITSKTGRVFSNSAGKPLVGTNRNDSVGLAFERIKIKLNMKKSVKHFRKTGATLLGNGFKAWQEIYLANCPKDVTAKNYDGTTILPAHATEHIRAELGL